jgi:hypothetical protein
VPREITRCLRLGINGGEAPAFPTAKVVTTTCGRPLELTVTSLTIGTDARLLKAGSGGRAGIAPPASMADKKLLHSSAFGLGKYRGLIINLPRQEPVNPTLGAAIICRVADYSFMRIGSMALPTNRRRRHGATVLIDAVRGPRCT